MGRLLLACLLPLNFNFAIAEAKVPMARTIGDEISRLSVKYKIDATTVRAIVKCESQMYGDAINHNIDKLGKIWSTDWGPLQINDYFHEKDMAKIGLDIHNQWDSLEYGFILISRQGFKPWSASAKCWLPLVDK